MRRLTIVTALAVMMFATPSAWAADAMTGAILGQACENSDDAADAVCRAYILGATDGVFLNTQPDGKVIIAGQHICPPHDLTGVQLYAVVKKWLKANPEKWHQPGIYCVVWSLQEAFPCKDSR